MGTITNKTVGFTALAIVVLLTQAPVVPHQSAVKAPTTAPAPRDYSKSSVVTRMMAFNLKHDGKLTKDEVTDERLVSLFDRADTNGDGIVTKDELMLLAAKLEAEEGQAGRGPGGGPPDDHGGPDDRGPGGRGGLGRGFGRGGPGGPPQPGQILPAFVQNSLQLTPEQKSQIDALQAEINTKLAAILTPEQNKQLKQFQSGGPGRGGPPGGGPPPQ